MDFVAQLEKIKASGKERVIVKEQATLGSHGIDVWSRCRVYIEGRRSSVTGKTVMGTGRDLFEAAAHALTQRYEQVALDFVTE